MSLKSEHKLVELERRVVALEALLAALKAEREERQTLRLARKAPAQEPNRFT